MRQQVFVQFLQAVKHFLGRRERKVRMIVLAMSRAEQSHHREGGALVGGERRPVATQDLLGHARRAIVLRQGA